MTKPRFPQDPVAWRAAAEAELADLREVGGPWATAAVTAFLVAMLGLAIWSGGSAPRAEVEADTPVLHARLAVGE
ncbi:hypothetical protein [Falsiroseomonas sp. HW251]|uniref:hypothetical protein n=1 Tax=Falsiroseomonas sp. HW251 TaxID=3390998 RepID=UPI003D320485